MKCPFCYIEKEKYISESEYCFAVYDIHPITKGHCLIIPKIHTENFFQLDLSTQYDAVFLLNKVKEMIELQYHPAGYNVGININRPAGQSVMHAHIHLIPRYGGKISLGMEDIVKKTL
jgi:Diadenosine tetraphosphate (Ap4A) hydrolase and other HIT family hydrolases